MTSPKRPYPDSYLTEYRMIAEYFPVKFDAEQDRQTEHKMQACRAIGMDKVCRVYSAKTSMPQICGFSILGVKLITSFPSVTLTSLNSLTSGLSAPTAL